MEIEIGDHRQIAATLIQAAWSERGPIIVSIGGIEVAVSPGADVDQLAARLSIACATPRHAPVHERRVKAA